MQIALEPMGDPNTLWPLYRDGLKFMKEVGHKSVKVMADLAYFLERGQALEDILLEPEACLHVHMAGVQRPAGPGRPRCGPHATVPHPARHEYTGGVSAACPWASSVPGTAAELRRRRTPRRSPT